MTFARQIASNILSLLAALIIARSLGANGNGAYNVGLLLPTTLGTLLGFGIAPATVYFVGSRALGFREAVRINGWVFVGLSLLGLAMGAVLIAVRGQALLPGLPTSLMWLSLAAYPLVLAVGLLSGIFQSLRKFRALNLVSAAQSALFFGGVCAFALADIRNVPGLMLIYIASNAAVVVAASLEVAKLYKQSAPAPAHVGRQILPLLLYGWRSHVGTIIQFINYRVDLFLVNLLLSTAAAGTYAVSIALAEKLWIISTAASTVLFPHLSTLENDDPYKSVVTPLASRLVLHLTLLGSLCLAAVAVPLVLLFLGQSYAGSIMPLLILLPGIVVVGPARVMANDISARGHPEINMYVSIATVVVNIAANLLLIPLAGLSGAASATTIAYVVCAIGTGVAYSRVAGVPWSRGFAFYRSDLEILRGLVRNRHVP
jgi:O-antigen/teichoic acid export membrane protein